MVNHRRGSDRRICGFRPRPTLNVAFFSLVSIVIIRILQLPDKYYTFEESSKGLKNNESTSIRFLLFLGIEGTGHHYWQDLIQDSPIFEKVQRYGLHPQYTKRLTSSLYRHKKDRDKGLWSAPCKWQDSDPTPNITAILNEIVDILVEMTNQASLYQSQHPETNDSPVIYPVNFLEAGWEFGVASYPMFLKPCRELQYPALDTWYAACDLAGVRCEHVYIYRDPYAVIQSTVENRDFNKDKLRAIHLYTTMLKILYTDLSIQKERTVGCWSYDAALSEDMLLSEVNPVLQFPDVASLKVASAKRFRPRPPLTESEKRRMAPSELSVFLSAMVDMHNTVVKQCQTSRTN